MPAAIKTRATQPTDSVAVRSISIPAADGCRLAATLFEPQPAGAATGPLTVVAGGAGIPARFYTRFATWLAAHSRQALTFDYRDIGASRTGTLAGSSTRMRDWAILDVAGVIDWAARSYSDRPLHWVGHSMGGFAPGLAHNNQIVARQLNVGTLSGYWRHMAVPERYRVRLLMGGVSPLFVRAFGYLPGKLLGGEDMPAQAFLEWRRWCMTPDFFFGDPTLKEVEHFAHFRTPIRFAQVEDDVWGTPAAVNAIAGRFTANTEKSIWRVRLADAGADRIGHHGFFRDQFRDTLWPAALAWLDGAPSR